MARFVTIVLNTLSEDVPKRVNLEDNPIDSNGICIAK